MAQITNNKLAPGKQFPDSPDSEYDELHYPEAEQESGPEDTDDVDIDIPIESCPRSLPYCSLHDVRDGLNKIDRKAFVSGLPIDVKIVDVLRVGANLLNPYLYIIQLQHGNYRWTIRRRYRHFQHLHHQLGMFYTTIRFPIPMKKLKERRKTLKVNQINTCRRPRFPQKPDALIGSEQLSRRANQLEEYLQSLLGIPLYRTHPDTLSFLEVSQYSFVEDLGEKLKEGVVKKRAGGHRIVTGCRFFCYMCKNWCSHYAERWLLLKDTYMAYVHPDDGRVHFVILMDQGFDIQIGIYQTGIKNGLLISNLTRRLLVKGMSGRNTKEWYDQIIAVSKETGRDFTHPNRFASFVPVRKDTQINWFVDGSYYFEAIADALEGATEEIFIAGWMLSPEIFLKRPILEGQKWRLDKILKRKAEQGVKIFVLLYKEVELALGINSLYSKQKLVEQHPENIKVLRHPDMTHGTLLWAHHEKIVVVDQVQAFIGGLDLCYGRWDRHEHRLVDLGGVIKQRGPRPPGNVPKTSSTPNIPGFGAFAVFQLAQATHTISTTPFKPVNGLEKVAHHSTSLHELRKPSEVQHTSRTPLLSAAVSVGSGLQSPPANSSRPADSSDSSEEDNDEDGDDSFDCTDEKKKSRKRVRFRRHRRNQSLDNEYILGSMPKSSTPDESSKEQSVEEILNDHLPGDNTPNSTKLWIGKDYTNFIVQDFVSLDMPFKDMVDRTKTPRMPWHDIGLTVKGKAARDVARHFIQRWNFTKSEKAKEHPAYPWLLPKSYASLENFSQTFPEDMKLVDCQVLRSVSTWSAGVKLTEESIHNAYVNAIENAKHFIYIENQFFITQSAGHKDVTNRIGDALYHRIVSAHKKGTIFRVYVILPLLPAFEGEFGTARGAAIQAVTHWNYASICRGSDSLLERLKAAVGDPTKYISFYGLRNHGVLFNDLVSELIYVHSKLLIVDDQIAIIGSANLNDRSMLGRRDSEIAIYLQDTDTFIGKMAGQDFAVGKVVSKLRQQIFKEFLGIINDNPSKIDLSDPVSDNFFKEIWLKTAAMNTTLYEKAFNCIPTDLVHTFADLRTYQSKIPLFLSDRKAAEDVISRIQGFLVLFPLQFLCNESLTPAPGTKEGLMPTSLWV